MKKAEALLLRLFFVCHPKKCLLVFYSSFIIIFCRSLVQPIFSHPLKTSFFQLSLIRNSSLVIRNCSFVIGDPFCFFCFLTLIPTKIFGNDKTKENCHFLPSFCATAGCRRNHRLCDVFSAQNAVGLIIKENRLNNV